MQLDARGGIVGQRLRLGNRIHWQMVFHIFAVQVGELSCFMKPINCAR